jgi:transposase
LYLTTRLLASRVFESRPPLADITHLLSPIQPAALPRRTQSAPPLLESRPACSRLDPLQRHAAVVLSQIGLSPKQAAPLVRCSPKVVRKWSEVYGETGDVEEKKRKGRPKLLDGEKKDQIVAAASESPKASTPIHVFTENLDGAMYRDILKEHLMKSKELFWPNGVWHFQQDNDPKHTSKIVSTYLAEVLCIKDYIIVWPPYSPDLNPIENLWADLKKRVEKKNAADVKGLTAAVKDEWHKTDPKLCEKLVASMPKRIARVVEYHGWPTGY